MFPTVIACGGTIESTLLNDGTKIVVGGIDRLLPEAEIIRFRTEPSFTYTVEDFLAIAELVHAQASGGPPIVTVGTDTLEDLALVLDCLAPANGVVITGAALGPELDGVDNLWAARLAAGDEGWPAGVAVVAFAGKLRAGRDVEESAPPPDLFAGSRNRALGVCSRDRVEWYHSVDPLEFSLPGDKFPSVGLAISHPAGSVEDHSFESFDIVVVQGYGAGNVRPDLWLSLERYLERGGIVVICSSTPGLPVSGVSQEKGGAAPLLEKGAWSARRLPIRKAALVATLAGCGVDSRARFDDLVKQLCGADG